MRPIRRGPSPKQEDFENYREALPDLISRLGQYCSYCERKIATMLAVEHIQPKGLPAYQHLIGRWENFLLSCVNCNSTKKDKDVQLDKILLPDRDNTFAAFVYLADGSVEAAPGLSVRLREMAINTLNLTGLNKKINAIQDENRKQVAIDRISQRLETWAVAKEAQDEVLKNPGNKAVRRLAVKIAKGTGFFSIWMTVFANDIEMRNRLIDAFSSNFLMNNTSGTRASNCFDSATTSLISPAPNPDNLPYGGKV